MAKSESETEQVKKFDWKGIAEKGERDSTIQSKLNTLIFSFQENSPKKVFKKNSKEYTDGFKEQVDRELNNVFSEFSELTEDDINHWDTKFRTQLRKTLKLTVKKKALASIEFDSEAIYKFFLALDTILDEVQVVVEEDRIYIRESDPSRIALIEILIYNNSFTFFKKGKIGVNLDDLHKVLKASSKDNATTTLLFGEEKLFITITSKKHNSTIKRTLENLDIDHMDIPIDNLNKINYPCQFAISKEKLNYLILNSGLYAEITTITCTPDKITFLESGQLGEMKLNWEKSQIDNLAIDIPLIKTEMEKQEDPVKKGLLREKIENPTISGSYSLTFFMINKKMADVLKNDNSIQFFLKDDHPLKTQIQFKRLGEVSVLFYLAPRIEEEEFEDDREEEPDE